MPETNPNYVPVDWGSSPGISVENLTDEPSLASVALAAEDETDYCPRCGGQNGNHELLCPMLETATLNSAGDPIKVGDRVHHLADAGQEERDTGVVTYVGPVEIHGVTVENGCRCKWNGSDDETPHHVDLLTVLL